MSSQPAAGKKADWIAASPPHAREPWNGDGCDTVFVNGRLAVMKGTEEGTRVAKGKMKRLYESAKLSNDMEAAFDIVDYLWNDSAYQEIKKRVLASGYRPILVSPHPAFDDDDAIDCDVTGRSGPRNAIPFAFAERLRVLLNGFANDEIRQGARVGRTKLPRFPKFLFQPHFVGAVDAERPYVLVDDNLGVGGTLAALRSHIVRNGGTVLGVTALAHSTGKHVPLALTESTLGDLIASYTHGLGQLWKEVVGHGSDCLTDGEGGFLVSWRSAADDGSDGPDKRLHALRTRLDKARATFK